MHLKYFLTTIFIIIICWIFYQSNKKYEFLSTTTIADQLQIKTTMIASDGTIRVGSNTIVNPNGSIKIGSTDINLNGITTIDPINNSIKYNIPPITDGLIAHYDASSVKRLSSKLKDLFGSNDATIVGRLPTVSNNIIFGTANTTIYFPTGILPLNYTLFTLAKYNGTNKKRIFTASNITWYSGFDESGNVGIAKHNSQHVSQLTSGIPSNMWILSTDQVFSYRVNGMFNKTSESLSSNLRTEYKLAINTPSSVAFGGYQSDFAIKCILVFNKELSLNDIVNIENWIISKYGLN